MKKQEYKIDGFIDRGSLQVGERMKFLDQNGVWHQTSPITHVEVAGSNVYVETANSVYRNYEPVHERAKAQELWRHQQQEFQPPTLERALAERSIESGKHPKAISEFDINKLIMVDRDGQGWYITPEQVQQGMHLQLECNLVDIKTGQSSSGTLDIPCVQDFAYKDGNLVIESRSSMFSSVDFTPEFIDLQTEKEQVPQIEDHER
jgi:hypothetical protein